MFLCYLLGSLLYSIEVTSKYRKCNVSLSYERYIKTSLCYAAWKNQNAAADTVRLLPQSNIDCVFFSFFVHLFVVSWPKITMRVLWVRGHLSCPDAITTKGYKKALSITTIMCRNCSSLFFPWNRLSTSANVLSTWGKKGAGFIESLFVVFCKGKKCLSNFSVVLSRFPEAAISDVQTLLMKNLEVCATTVSWCAQRWGRQISIYLQGKQRW